MLYEEKLTKWQRWDTRVSLCFVLVIVLHTFLLCSGSLPFTIPQWSRILFFAIWFLTTGLHRCVKPLPSGTDLAVDARKKRTLGAALIFIVAIGALALSLAMFLELKPAG